MKVRLFLFYNIVIILKAERDIFYLVIPFYNNKPECDLTDFEIQAEPVALSPVADNLAFTAAISR